MRAFETGFFCNARHTAVLTRQMIFKIGALKASRASRRGISKEICCMRTIGESASAPSSEDAAEADSPIVRMQHISFDIPLRDARDAFERAYFEYHLARQNGSMTRI